jgi:hypothetical protein
MPDDSASVVKTTDRPIDSYKLNQRKNGGVEIVVTSGALKGKTALVIPTSPAAAYFAEKK